MQRRKQLLQHMKSTLLPIFSLGSFLLLSGPLWAHHGWSSYDHSSALTITGRVTSSGYEHPHGFVVINAEGKSLKVVLAPPFRMENRGLSRDAIQPGREVTVEGFALRADPSEIRAERITVSGKVIELR